MTTNESRESRIENMPKDANSSTKPPTWWRVHGPGPVADLFLREESNGNGKAGSRQQAVASLVANIGLKEVALHLPDSPKKTGLLTSLDQAIEDDIDYCGNVPHWPYPHFGSYGEIYAIVSELAVLANSLQEGFMKVQLLKAGARILYVSGAGRAAVAGE